MKAIASWSGGKDSCLACYKALKAGHEIASLLSIMSPEHKRSHVHGIKEELLALQSKLIDIPLIVKECAGGSGEFQEGFLTAVRDARDRYGIEAVIFGDIYLDATDPWADRMCVELEMKPIKPLWSMAPAKIMEEFLSAGFKAVVVNCKADLLGMEFIGKPVDEDFLSVLAGKDICPCGENGEYHTLVTGGPLFQGAIQITRATKVLRKGFWKHWSLDITEWEVESSKTRNWHKTKRSRSLSSGRRARKKGV